MTHYSIYTLHLLCISLPTLFNLVPTLPISLPTLFNLVPTLCNSV